MDDSSLLCAFVQDHAEPAFEQLVARYLPLVHSAALRRTGGDPHRAREVTQMVFSELARKASRLVGHSALAAWLHQSTRWHASMLRRAELRRARHEAAAAEHLAILGTPDETPSWEILAPQLDEALDTLRDADREAVLQRYFLDRPFVAIGRHLGVSENAARMRVDRALDALRSALARRGVTSTSAALALALAQNTSAAIPAGVTSSTIAATACQTAIVGAVAAATTQFLMTKLTLAITAAVAAALSVALWRQDRANARLAVELAALQASPTSAIPSASAPSAPDTVPVFREIENEILAAAEYAVPLTPEQRERVRLDTIVRKGGLDADYAMLFRQLRLPRETLDALKTLIVERNQAIHDVRQLAKEEGLDFAALAEEQELDASATRSVDSRISALIGPGGLASLREYLDLGVFRRRAEIVRQNQASRHDSADDERVLQLARKLREAAPDYPDQLYQSNGWGLEDPPAFREMLVAAVGTTREVSDTRADEVLAIERRMAEIAQKAVFEGRVPMARVSGSVSREYKAALANPNGGSRP
jgi:RNA polymerase sigma factor (sigma-70 family)